MARVETDSALSLEAEEFVWAKDGLTAAHRYLLPAVRRVLQQAGARTVLDLGCGNGALTAALAQAGFEMTGLDMSESGLALARRNYPGIRFMHAGLEAPLPAELHQAFDAVVAVEVIEHLLLPRVLFHRAHEALRPGGTLVVTTPYHGYLKNLVLALTNRFDAHWHPLRDYGHVKFFSRATLTKLFQEQQFVVEQVARLGRVPPLAKSMMVQGRLLP